MSRTRKKYWVLRQQSGTRTDYFHHWTGIGPKATQDLQEAAKFSTKQEAMQSPAYSFGYTFYEPFKIRGDQP